jgi:hypothetical protein
MMVHAVMLIAAESRIRRKLRVLMPVAAGDRRYVVAGSSIM